MNIGIGFSEVVLIVCLVVLFFGTKELPRFLRESARVMARLRSYSERIRRELDELARPINETTPSLPSSAERKKELRSRYREKINVLSAEERLLKSSVIWQHCERMPEYRAAQAVMVYVSTQNEVDTHGFIRTMMQEGKRVIVPYCDTATLSLGLGWIEDFERDLAPASFGILEPVAARRNNFFKSDLHLVICPGLAFDRLGARLGRGNGYYDRFLVEIRGKVPIFGFAFDCQIMEEPLPFDYHDVPMNEVITESGCIIRGKAQVGYGMPGGEVG